MRFLQQLLRRKARANGSGSASAIPTASQAPPCDRCGKQVQFEGPESGTVSVTFSTPPVTRTVCTVCAREEEKQRQWRQTGIWIGEDLPPSLKSMRPATPEELRKLRGEDD